ncbi:MAG: BlaI/MecI/CopY family transcriptional regulator [Ruminococcaceae bacterium]|nr:BlaI/MecI/CopY family transcriptional regulator [Oscillospiraceae bacterium]
MNKIDIWDSDYRFMLIVWEHAPVRSGRLVVLSRERLGWKKSTTYNAIRRMSEKGLIRNDKATVRVLVPKEQVQAQESHAFLERTFDGSLPRFVAAFLNGKAISSREAEEIRRLINEHQEEDDGNH